MWIVVAAWVAATLVFCSFFMKTMIPLRIVAIESPEEVKAAVEQTRIVEVLAGLDGATSVAVAETIELPDSTVRRHLNVLLERGHVVREGLGKRGNPFRWRAADTENTE
jgi:DNA-binding transcriptional ArsR family regulator